MKTIKVFFSDGDTLITRINGTLQEIEEYYIDKSFSYYDAVECTEKKRKVIKVTIL